MTDNKHAPTRFGGSPSRFWHQLISISELHVPSPKEVSEREVLSWRRTPLSVSVHRLRVACAYRSNACKTFSMVISAISIFLHSFAESGLYPMYSATEGAYDCDKEGREMSRRRQLLINHTNPPVEKHARDRGSWEPVLSPEGLEAELERRKELSDYRSALERRLTSIRLLRPRDLRSDERSFLYSGSEVQPEQLQS